jgi:hypothetical protein
MNGIFMIYHFLGSNAAKPQMDTTDSSAWMAAIVPVALSIVIRWLVIPRTKSAQAALPLFVMGIAFAEASCLLGIFVFPAHKQDLFTLSALGIFQFVPFFARRYFTPVDQIPTT